MPRRIQPAVAGAPGEEVSVGGEGDLVDRAGLFGEIAELGGGLGVPDADETIIAPRSEDLAVRRKSENVEVAGVSAKLTDTGARGCIIQTDLAIKRARRHGPPIWRYRGRGAVPGRGNIDFTNRAPRPHVPDVDCPVVLPSEQLLAIG